MVDADDTLPERPADAPRPEHEEAEVTGQPPADRPSAAQLSHALVEATESLICVVDGEGRIMLANAALERFTGRGAEDLVGRLLYDVLIIPEETGLARAAVAASMAGG